MGGREGEREERERERGQGRERGKEDRHNLGSPLESPAGSRGR